MNDDLEDRLRRTYRAVGEHTSSCETTAAGCDAELRPAGKQPAQHRRWASVGIAASVVLLLVGGLAVIQRNSPDGPADATFDHVLPTLRPKPFGGPRDREGGAPRLVSVESSADVDVLEYVSDVLSVTIRVDRAPLPELAGPSVEVRGGQRATTDGDGRAGRLRWFAVDGPAVTIAWVGMVFGGVESIVEVVDGLLLVDASVWDAATEFGGFTDEQEVLRRTIGPTEVHVRGDLQSGMVFGVDGSSGFDPQPCQMVRLRDFETWAVVSRFPSGTATVTWSDGVVANAELAQFVPGSYLGVGLAERTPFETGELPDVTCEEAS